MTLVIHRLCHFVRSLWPSPASSHSFPGSAAGAAALKSPYQGSRINWSTPFHFGLDSYKSAMSKCMVWLLRNFLHFEPSDVLRLRISQKCKSMNIGKNHVLRFLKHRISDSFPKQFLNSSAQAPGCQSLQLSELLSTRIAPDTGGQEKWG